MRRRSFLSVLLASPLARFIQLPTAEAAPAVPPVPDIAMRADAYQLLFGHGMQIHQTLGAPSVATFSAPTGTFKLGDLVRIACGEGDVLFVGTIWRIDSLLGGNSSFEATTDTRGPDQHASWETLTGTARRL
jgi:hypothetical protein